jgi:alkylresorcinol/alkylpyrone synthase
MAEILGLSTALPSHVVTLQETQERLAAHFGDAAAGERFQRMAEQSRVATRHLVLPIEEILSLRTIEQRESAYARHAVTLSEAAATRALAAAKVDARSVDAVISVSCTGYMLPSMEVHLSHRLGIDPSARRIPISQLGCSGGVAAVGLARELAGRDGAGRCILVVSTELASLCLQTEEPAVSDVMGGILFGDGSAAAVITGDDAGRGLRLVAGTTVLWPETTPDLRMRLTSTGFRLDLSRHVPRLIRRHLRPTVEAFLERHGTKIEDVAFWAIHPGGPKVLEAIGESLELPDAALVPSWEVWQRCGNVSSATALLILREVLDHHAPARGGFGVLLAPGPGLTCELVLLRVP